MQLNGRLPLAENATTGNGTAYAWKGGKGIFTAEATWGGGSVKLQYQTANGTWLDVTNGSFTANGYLSFDLPPGMLRVVIATSTVVYAYAIGNQQ